MDPFLEKFFPDVYADMKDSRTSNYYMFDSQLLIAFTSALYIAGLFASFCASKVMQAFNHRASMLLGGAVFLVGDVLGGLAIIVFVLILGRILPPRRRRRFHQTGILYWLRSSLLYLFFFVQSAPLYLSEMAPPEYRGAINNGFDFFIGFGTLSANMINFERCYLPLLYEVRYRVYDIPYRWSHHPLHFCEAIKLSFLGVVVDPARPGNIAAHCQRRASAAHLLADKLKSSSGAGLLTFTEMPDVINSLARNSKANSVTDALHSAADFFCSLSSPSSTVLSPQPRAMLPDLLDGAISCFLPRHRSVGMGDLLLPPSTQICNRSPASSLDTDLRSLCGLVRLQDSTASGRVWQPPEPDELRPILLLLLLQQCLEEPQSFSFPASKRQWTYRFILHI
ncbi:hypothetical protein BHE74_00025705 [Ensete ventricosum]|nr:hypothetical protein BHE74_00025705 [Ensete ventricosum]RZS19307.1 hypothetical protein BHM03_00051682 [Ensete ventricosum]